MLIDFVAGETHLLDHLYPIWAALPAARRGHIILAHTHPQGIGIAGLVEHAQRCRYVGCIPMEERHEALRMLYARPGPIVVASINNAHFVAPTKRPMVFCEHGAGQTYVGNYPSYAGGRGRRNVALFVCPNQSVAEHNRAAYPDVPTAIVGCPKLDRYHRLPAKPRPDPPVIAFSVHWDCRVCPETRTSFLHFRPALKALARRYPTVGHAHPRIFKHLTLTYQQAGIEPLADFADVMERADVYICDNSSTMFEFASLDRPVVVLNAPWYRRDVNHGLRFWDAATVGVQCDEPGELLAAVAEALEDRPEQQRLRKQAVALAYATCDGHAAERAAAAILALE